MKVKRVAGGKIVSDDKHELGGIDVRQVVMFRHIVPSGDCDEITLELLEHMAWAHGWGFEITNEF